ncbi:MAG: hypothetical protein QOH81_3240 [Sphingomonadales bacterium]|jgi:hypothetical protein|nr:hypothetical protein [Sphingomonadales bacterium]
MRVIPPQFFAKYPLRADFEMLLVWRGYSRFPAGGSGGTILMHPGRNLVWKIADDPATRALSEMMLIAPVDPALPRFFAVADKKSPYSVIAMEKLAPFPQHSAWTAWLEGDFQATRGSPATDPFRASGTLHWLLNEIKARGGELDVQAKNVLVRRGTQQIVFFDPVY